MNTWRVIFDLGGVLFDWNPARILENFYPQPDLRALMLAAVYQHPDWLAMDEGRLDDAQAQQRFAARSGRPPEEVAALLQATRESLQPIADTWRLLADLHDGDVPLYCLSNMADSTYRHLRHAHPGWERFSGIVISAHERMLKPQAQIFELIVRRYQLPAASTVFIDDMPANVAAARDCGLQAVLFRDAASCAAELSKITGGALPGPGWQA